jgi:hypothetical protein
MMKLTLGQCNAHSLAKDFKHNGEHVLPCFILVK